MASNVLNYREQGGGRWVIGGRQAYDDGSAVEDAPLGVGFTVGAEATNAITVNVQFYADPQNSVECASIVHSHFYLTNSNSTLAPATAPSGGMAVGTDGALVETLSEIAGIAVSEADGDFDLVITDTGTPTFYIVMLLPDGRTVLSPAITFS